jgi:guanyl-specific ribonuclease Sa
MGGSIVETQRRALTEHSTQTARTAARAAAGTPAAVLALQRTAGNRAVCRLVDRDARVARKKGKGGGTGSAEQKKLKAAPNQSEYQFAQLPQVAQNAIQQILNGNEGPYLRPNHGWHATDPETGLPKGQGVGVREYHVTPSDETKRIVTRGHNNNKSVYYDGSHPGGTYTYHRVTGAPWPAAAPAPAPAVAPVAPAAAVPAAAPVLPAVQAPGPVVDDWEQLTG